MGDYVVKSNSRKMIYNWLLVAVLLLVTVAMIVGLVVFRMRMSGSNDALDRTKYEKYYVIITEERDSSFWQSVYTGAYEQALEQNAYVDLLGEDLSENYSTEELMRIAIASKVDGIIVSADESEEMTTLINEAVEEGIPVVTIYGDNTQSNRCSYVGVGSYNLGREYGRQVIRIATERLAVSSYAENEELGLIEYGGCFQVAVLVNTNTNVKDAGQNILCSGIQDAISQNHNENISVELSLISVDDTNTFSMEESIRKIFMAEKLPDIIICQSELSTVCVYQTIVDYNKVGLVDILGYYNSDTILKAIDRNVVYATLSIDTVQMGKHSIDALTEYYELGNTSQYFTVDITLINKNNVSQYLGG